MLQVDILAKWTNVNVIETGTIRVFNICHSATKPLDISPDRQKWSAYLQFRTRRLSSWRVQILTVFKVNSIYNVKSVSDLTVYLFPKEWSLWSVATPHITRTCLYNFDPLKPHFYIVKLGFTGVHFIFLISARNMDCGYSLEPPHRGGSNEYPQSMFWAEIWKNIRNFYLKVFIFFGGKILNIFE